MARSLRSSWPGWLFVAPALVLTILFFLWPLGLSIWMSGWNWPLIGRPRWIGLANYWALLDDPVFGHAVLFTIVYALVITPLLFVVALALALLADTPHRLVGLFRTIWFLPSAIGISTASVLWVWMLNGDVGIFTWLANGLGLLDGPIPYLDTTFSALMAAVSMVIWKTAGFNMLLLLVGLQAIPKELLEAARIDGAGFFQSLRFVKLPLMRRTFKLALVVSISGSLLAFDQFYIITRGGPQNGTITMVYWIYQNGFSSFRVGYASAMAVVLLVMALAVAIGQLILLRDKADA